jgi:serine protease Do
MSLKRLSISLACLAALCPPAGAETIYRWTDTDGSARFTHSQPNLGIAYETFEVPDPVKWFNAPTMPGEVASDAGSTTQNIFKSLSKSVYGLKGVLKDDSGRSRGVVFGSAVAITDKLAITNCHVLENAGEAIYLGAGASEEPEQAKLVGANYEADRCVVSVSRMDLHPVPGIRRFEALEVGETVYAIGNPLKLDRTLSEGLLSGKREAGERRYLQTTAPISPGSSGGGLFDAHGNLIGITSFTLKGAQSLNFAIPAEDYWK